MSARHRWGSGSLDDALQALERALAPGPFFCGEQFTEAAVVVGSSLAWGMLFGTIDKRPSFTAYTQRCMERPAFIRAAQRNDARMQGRKE